MDQIQTDTTDADQVKAIADKVPVPIEVNMSELGLVGRDARLRQLAGIGQVQPDPPAEPETTEKE